MGEKYICPYRDDKPACDNRVAKLEMKRESYDLPSYEVCAACLEGIRTRAYFKAILERSGIINR